METIMSLWLVLLGGFVLAWFLTGALRRYALTHNIMDIPNDRSSHTVPTPRGGGVAIVVSFLALLPLLRGEATITWTGMLAIMGAGAWIASIGFLDDHGHIQARWRLLAHFIGAAWALYWLDGFPPMPAFDAMLNHYGIGLVLAAFYLVWMLNLYNFMDGIDGIAGIQAICVALGGAALYGVTGQPGMALAPLLLASAVAGFLIWNFPPAKIFMGDAGSGFLGIALGILSLQAAWVAPRLLACWLILLGVFIVDATLTLLWRLFRGDKVYQAHCSHAYQNASRKYGGHLPVTLAVLVINVVWLFPLSWLVAAGDLGGVAGMVVAYTPLFAIAMAFRAGQLEKLPGNQ